MEYMSSCAGFFGRSGKGGNLAALPFSVPSAFERGTYVENSTEYANANVSLCVSCECNEMNSFSGCVSNRRAFICICTACVCMCTMSVNIR